MIIRKKASESLTMHNIISFVLVAVVLVLVVFGAVNGAFSGAKDRLVGFYDRVLVMLNFTEQTVLGKKGEVLGKERIVEIDSKGKRCTVQLEEFGESYCLNLRLGGRLEKGCKGIYELEVSFFKQINPFTNKINRDLSFRYFGDKWQWSVDMENWMNVPEILVQGGDYDGKQPIDNFVEIIEELEGADAIGGYELLKKSGSLVECEWVNIDNKVEGDDRFSKLKTELKEICY